MNSLETQPRLLWNEPRVVGACGAAIIVTVAIIVWQMNLRIGHFDPDAVPIFYRLFLFEDYAGAFLFLLTLLLALAPAMQRVATAIAHWLGDRPNQIAVGTSVVLAAGAYWVYRAHPLAMDESAPYMQAQIFATGALVGQLPRELIDWLVYPPFQDYFIHVSHVTGEVASAYWPGFALLLTPFMALGVPWLCNPVLGGLSVWIVHRLTLELTESTVAAGAAVLFTVGSAAFVVNAISFYSMTAHLLCNGDFVVLLLKPTQARAAVAGVVGGLALTLHNPVPHMLFALPWLTWLAWRPESRRFLPAIFAGYLPWVVFVGFGWHHLLQGLKAAPEYAAAKNGVGPLSTTVAMLKGVLRLPEATQLLDRTIGLAKLWLWAAPMLTLVACLGFWRSRGDARYRLLAASAMLTFIGYLFVPLSQGHGWGFRYFHSTWFVLPVLAAGVVPRSRDRSLAIEPSGIAAAGRFALAGALGGLLVMTPFFLWQVHSFINQHLGQLPTAESGHPRVVIISPSMGYYAQDLVQNDPFLEGVVIRMVSQGRDSDLSMMQRYFPDLELLSKDFRGSVWGYKGEEGDGISAPPEQ